MLSYFITKFLSALTPPFCPIFIGFIFIGVKFGFGTFFFLLLSVRLGAQCFELLFPFSVMIFLVGEVWMRDAVDFVSYFSAAINTRETEMEQIIHIRGQSVWLTVLSLFRMTKATRKLYAFCCHLRPNFVDIVIRHDALCVHRKMSIKMKIKATAPPLDDFSRNRAQFRTPKIIETSILPATADIGETSYSTWIIISMSFAVNGMRFQIASSFKHRRFSISLIMTFCFFLSTAQNQFHTASASQREQE